jgi:hypothetical protein
MAVVGVESGASPDAKPAERFMEAAFSFAKAAVGTKTALALPWKPLPGRKRHFSSRKWHVPPRKRRFPFVTCRCSRESGAFALSASIYARFQAWCTAHKIAQPLKCLESG